MNIGESYRPMNVLRMVWQCKEPFGGWRSGKEGGSGGRAASIDTTSRAEQQKVFLLNYPPADIAFLACLPVKVRLAFSTFFPFYFCCCCCYSTSLHNVCLLGLYKLGSRCFRCDNAVDIIFHASSKTSWDMSFVIQLCETQLGWKLSIKAKGGRDEVDRC